MSDFDSKLRLRLGRLEAAAPEPSPPRVRARPERPERSRGRVVLALVAVLALATGTSLVASGTAPPPDPAQQVLNAAQEERVLEDLAAHEGDACRDANEAAALFRHRLDALGLPEWTLRIDRRIQEAPCVSAGVSGETQEVILIASMGSTVARAIDALSIELLDRCLGWGEASALVRSRLQEAGISNPQIALEGVRAVPVDEQEAARYLQHVADGCVVYGRANSDLVGRYTWYLSGR